MRCSYTFEELHNLAADLPAHIEFPICCRKEADYRFSVRTGEIDSHVLAVIHSLSLKLDSENTYAWPITKRGEGSNDPDCLFDAISSVMYDDKNGSNYQLHFDDAHLSMYGKQVIAALKRENYWINVDIGSPDDGHMIFGVIG